MTRADETALESGHPDRWRTLAVACLCVFLLVMTLSALNVALPDIADEFGAEIPDLQWIVDSYGITFAGLLLAGGALGDRIGRRSALTLGLGIFAVAHVIATLASSIPMLIAMRALAGFGAAVMMPASLAAVSQVFSDDERGRAIAIWSSVAAAGGAFGPGLGGALLTLSGWPLVFGANAMLATVGLAGALAWVPRLPGQRVGRFDGVGAALSIAAIVCLVYVAIEGPAHPLAPATLLAATATVVLVVGLYRHLRRTDHPLVPLEIFANRERSAGAATLLLAAFGFNGILFVGALFLQIGWGESALAAGALLMPIGIVEVIVANYSVQLRDRFDTRTVIRFGLVAMAAGYVALGLTPEGNRWWFIVAGMVAGLGNGLAIPLSIDRIMADAAASHAGVVASISDISIELGAIVGVGFLGALQRTWFERQADVDASRVDEITSAAERGAFQDASTAAFILATIVALAAIPIASRGARTGVSSPG